MKALRYTVIGGFAFILITGGLLVGLANLDANRYRGFLSEQISQRLGRSFEIRKDLSLSFYPYLEVDAAGVAVGNPDGFGEALFAQVDHLKLRIHTLSLIQKKLVMDAVQVNGVRVNLVKNKDGKGNWEAWQAPASAVPKNIQPEKKTDNGDSAVKERQPPVAVTLGQPGIHLPENFEAMLGLLGAGAEIKDANLEFNDLQSGKEFSVTDLDFHLAPFAPDTPMPLILGGRFEAGGLSGPVSLNASLLPDLTQNKIIITPFQVDLGMAGSRNIPEVSLSSAIEFDLAKDLLVLDQLAVTGPDTLVKGRISLFRISSEAPAMDMEIDAAGKDFTALLRAAGAERLADQFQGLTDKSFDVSGQVEASSAENTIVVSGLNIRMLDANIKGDVRVEQRRMGKPAMKGDLKAAGPDLPALIQVIAGILGKETAVSVIAPDLNRLKDKSFDLNTLFDTDLHGGRVEIKNLKARGLGIEIDSQISAHGIFSLMPVAKGRLRARGTDLPLVLALADSLTGKKEFSRWMAAAPGKSFETDVSMDLDMGRGRMTLPKFQVKGLGLTIDGRFDADKIGTKKAVLNGELDLAAREIGWLFKTLKQERAADFIRSLYVKTKISGGQGKVLLAPFLATADLTPAQAKQFPGGVELKAPLILDLTGQSISSDNILFRGMGLTLKGELKAENIQTTPGVTGQVDLSLKKLRKFMAAMDMPLPATADSKVFSVLELETKISGTRDSLALKGIKARLDDTGVTGRISLAGASNPAVDAVLGLDRINLDRYLPGPVQKETPKKRKDMQSKVEKAGKASGPKLKKAPVTPETAAVAAAEMIPVELIRSLRLKGDFNIAHLILSKIRLSDVKAKIRADKGKLSFAPVSANLYKGIYTGDVTLDAVPDVPKLAVNSELAGVNIEPLLNDMTGKAQLKGVGNVTLALTTNGNSEAVMKRNLNGDVGFAFKNGAVTGFNLGQFLRRLKSYRENQNFEVSEREETDFSELSGHPKVKNGVVTLSDLKGKAPALRLSGKGVLADLNTEIMDYTTLATVVETSKGQTGKELEALAGVTIPVRITGPLKKPEIQPDIGVALAALASRELGKVLTDKLGIKPLEDDNQDGKADPADALKKSLEKELGNIFKRLTE